MLDHLATQPPDEALLDQVAAQLDLRKPNRDAIETLALRLSQWYERDRDTFFEGVIDSATGVGKTFIIAGAIDYYAALGIRNFAVIAPGATILRKTVAQFSPGPKSLLPRMETDPKVITSENFETSEVASSLLDDSLVKLYVFTVQSLLRPTTNAGRKTHEFREGLGGAFYAHLDGMDDLIVFADEHHTYFGDAFSKAVRGLTPLALVGLTGTPNKKTAESDIIFRYPLTAAILDEYVKTPVLVGRMDDRVDEFTQLLDGATLLDAKETALTNYCQVKGLPFIHPIMLVNCRDIDHARETVQYLKSDEFFDGKYAAEGAVLEVHSDQADEALADLDLVEDADSPCRIIVQVGMLKEGWDVKNVYVIASLRASVSEILTEQTLGRGLRLPFGGYIEMPLLNELDVLAHERYEDLLKRTGTLRESFIDKRTIIERFMNSDAEEETGVSTETVDIDVSNEPDPDGGYSNPAGSGQDSTGLIGLGSTEERVRQAKKAAEAKPLLPRDETPEIQIPVVRTTPVAETFRLEMVVDEKPFRELGRSLAVEPDEYLKRTKLGGRVKEVGGLRVADITTDQSVVRIEAALVFDDEAIAKQAIVADVMLDRAITKRTGEPVQVARLLEAVIEGAGDKANTVLSSYRRALVAGMIREIHKAKKKLPTASQTTQVIATQVFKPLHYERSASSGNYKGGDFQRGLAYTGWKRCMFDQAWFDSSPERDAANILDESDEIETWVRLQIKDLPILWDGAERGYNPDLLALDTAGAFWIVETKADRDMTADEVIEKRDAALAWSNAVTPQMDGKWSYLLVSESDLKDAQGSWKRLKKATSA